MTEEQIKYFAERVNESPTGKLIVSSNLVEKYRMLTNDYDSPNGIIRERILKEINK